MHLSSSPFTVKPVAVAAVMALATLAAHSPLAQAQASVAASQQLNLNIAAQPLGQALNALAQQANLQMSFPAALVAGKQAPVVSGRMSVKQALDLLLESHGLTAVLQGNAVVVRQLDVVKQSEVVLPVVTITAATDNDPGQLPKAFAGGQVASGARIGVLGNRDIFETPVSVVAYTSELALNQQARTVAEVLRNDTSVKITQNTNSGGTDDVYNLRSFLSASTASTYDGLPRLIGRSQALEGIERVELLKGPTAFAVGSALFFPRRYDQLCTKASN